MVNAESFPGGKIEAPVLQMDVDKPWIDYMIKGEVQRKCEVERDS